MIDTNKVRSPYQEASAELEKVYSTLFGLIKLPLIYQDRLWPEGCAQIIPIIGGMDDLPDEPPAFLKDVEHYEIYVEFKESNSTLRIAAEVNSDQRLDSLSLLKQIEDGGFRYLDSLENFLKEPSNLSDGKALHYLKIFNNALEKLWQSYYDKYYLQITESFSLQSNRRLFEMEGATLKKIEFDKKFPQKTLDSF